ncbi:MAG: hypothetical protein ACTSUO_01015 [Candidatus Thorarchaeota archaeon]
MKFNSIGKIITIIGIGMLLISVIGFISAASEKEGYLISETRDETSAIYHSQILEGNHSYELQIVASESTYDEDAVVRATFVFYVDGAVSLNDSLYSKDNIDIGNDPDRDRTGSASDIENLLLSPTEDVNFTVVGEMTSGDYWYVKVYQDVPASIGTNFITYSALMIIGVFVFLGGVIVIFKTKDNVQGMTDA